MALFWFLLALLIFFLDTREVFEPLRTAVQSVTIPVKAGLASSRESALSPFRFILLSRQKGEKITELEEKIASLSATLARVHSIEEENEKLRKLLGAPLPSSWKFSPARVVAQEEDILVLISDYNPTEGTPVIVPPPLRQGYAGQARLLTPQMRLFRC